MAVISKPLEQSSGLFILLDFSRRTRRQYRLPKMKEIFDRDPDIALGLESPG
jgi:hypothetical protein